jgi:hypothetical protein
MTDPRSEALQAARATIERLENAVRLVLSGKPARDIPETYGEAAHTKKLIDTALLSATPATARAVAEMIAKHLDEMYPTNGAPAMYVRQFAATLPAEAEQSEPDIWAVAEKHVLTAWMDAHDKARGLPNKTVRPATQREPGRNLYDLAYLIQRIPESMEDDENVLAVLQRANKLAKTLDDIERANSAASKVPEGWKLVPINPREEDMRRIANLVSEPIDSSVASLVERCLAVYQAMLAAAPTGNEESA